MDCVDAIICCQWFRCQSAAYLMHDTLPSKDGEPLSLSLGVSASFGHLASCLPESASLMSWQSFSGICIERSPPVWLGFCRLRSSSFSMSNAEKTK
jgi:hypothetical protein